MQTNQAQFVRAATQISHSANQRRIIREGSSVLVRIIADRGGGKYEASVAGNRLILTSGKPLETGSTFVGKIGLKSGQIIITRNGVEETLILPELKTATFLESGGIFEKIISPELAGFLQAMNLPSDNLSFHILLQFKQLGLKLNPATMKKIRQTAEKSKNPKATTEKLISLAQKGINIIDGKTVQADDDSHIPLELFNSLGFGKKHENENSWIFLPFEIENIAEKSIVGGGMVKLLLRTNDKSLLMMNVEINVDGKSYRFLIDLDGKKIKSIKYSLKKISGAGNMKSGADVNAIFGKETSGTDEEDKSITESLKKTLSEIGNEATVEWMPFDMIDGTASGLEEFSLAGGFA